MDTQSTPRVPRKIQFWCRTPRIADSYVMAAMTDDEPLGRIQPGREEVDADAEMAKAGKKVAKVITK